MNNNLKNLKRKLLYETISLLLLTLCIGILFLYMFVDGVLQSWIAEGIVEFIQSILHLDYYDARNIYFKWIVTNKPVIITLFFLFLLLIVIYFIGLKVTKYFNEIAQAVHELLNESESPIKLSEGLEFMAYELNEVKRILRHRERVARESEQRKNDLVMYLAHDIKTPLTSIIGYLTLLNETPELSIICREKYTKICLDKSYRLENLINEFFEITRFNLYEVILEKEIVNLTFMMEQLVDEFYPLLIEKQLEIKLSYEEEIEFYGDVDKLARAFNNFLKNAVAYSYLSSCIEIDLIKTSKEVKVTFKNQGKIIPKHKLEAIFEKFYRLDSARASNSGGSGLGLAISKEIIEAHQGTIEVESRDTGTIFTIHLPTGYE